MGKVIYVDFRREWQHDCYADDDVDTIDLTSEPLQLEILDEVSGDLYLYFEEDMIPEDPIEWESFADLTEMIDEY